MQVSDKLIKPLTEAKYLNADNVSRYRCIMRIFFEHYEKLKYWLYQEEVYEEMIQDPLFADYRLEQCQQDLTMLTEWKNLNTIQDTKKVASIEEFKNNGNHGNAACIPDKACPCPSHTAWRCQTHVSPFPEQR